MGKFARPVVRKNVAPGIHMIQHADVNAFIVQEGTRGMAVDAGLPGMWPLLSAGLEYLGLAADRLEALVLTHGHFDHVGNARRLGAAGVPVYVHKRDARLAAHPYTYRHEKNRVLFPLRHPGGLPSLARMAAAGALMVRGVEQAFDLTPEAASALPGSPQLIHTPGHTYGHCALYFPQHSTIITGDALVTLDPYTGRRGPRIVAGAATADSSMALDALRRMEDTEADLVLPRHGDPFTGGIGEACRLAVEAGAA